MKSGTLDRRILIQFVTLSQNDVGESVETWAPFADCWAGREPQRVLERFAADQRLAEADTVFRIRWFPNAEQVAPQSHRIVYRGRVYEIMGTFEIGRKEGAHIVTKSRTDLGGTP